MAMTGEYEVHSFPYEYGRGNLCVLGKSLEFRGLFFGEVDGSADFSSCHEETLRRVP